MIRGAMMTAAARAATPVRLACTALALAVAIAFVAAPARASGGSAEAAFDRGSRLYEEGDYEGAAAAFGEVLDTGVSDPVVHYNLANAWFKSGRLGPAIYHYRRAHSLAPRDEDIAANLEYARFLALDRIEADTATDRPVDGLLDRITPREAARLPVVLFILLGAAACATQLAPASRFWRRSTGVLLVLWAVSLAGAWAVRSHAARVDEAVVVASEATVRNGPGESFDTAFVLHEGAEVVVEGERGAWTEVSLPGDLRGWLAAAQISRL